MREVVFILCYLAYFCDCGISDSYRLESQMLKKQLLQNYSTSVKPSNPTLINVSFSPIAILALDEASQIFSFSGVFLLVWNDLSMTWNPAMNPVEQLEFDENEIWTPTLVIPNGVGNVIEPLSSKIPVSVLHFGRLTMFVMKQFEVICDVDMTWYPYDDQTCRMTLMALGDITLQLGMSHTGDIFTSYFTGSSEWQLLNFTKSKTSVGSSYKQDSINVDFRLRRHSIFYTLSIIFPMCLLSFLNCCVFLLPAASGEKISFLVSIFVSGAVFLNFINDSIPKSNNASRLTIYLVLLLGQCALALLATLLVMNIYHDEGGSLCGKTKVSTQEKAQAWGDGSQSRSRYSIGKIDKTLFLVFLAMAAASLLVFIHI